MINTKRKLLTGAAHSALNDEYLKYTLFIIPGDDDGAGGGGGDSEDNGDDLGDDEGDTEREEQEGKDDWGLTRYNADGTPKKQEEGDKWADKEDDKAKAADKADEDRSNTDDIKVDDKEAAELLKEFMGEDGALDHNKVAALAVSQKDLRRKVSVLGEKAKERAAPESYKLSSAAAQVIDKDDPLFQDLTAKFKESEVSQAEADVVFDILAQEMAAKSQERASGLEKIFGERAGQELEGMEKFYKKLTQGDKELAASVREELQSGSAESVYMLHGLMKKYEGAILPSAGAHVAQGGYTSIEAIQEAEGKLMEQYQGDWQNPTYLEKIEALTRQKRRLEKI